MGRAAERKGSGPAEKDGYSARTDLFNFSPNPPCFAAANASARYAFSVLLCAAVVFHSPASDAIQGWYSRARETAFLKHDSFEPAIASLAFGFWVALFRVLDRVPWCQKFKLCQHEKQAVPKDMKPPMHALLSLVCYLAPLALFDSVYPRRTLPLEAPSLGGIVAQLALGLVVYDFLFFWVHLALHKVPALRWVGHARHHSITPLDATQVVNHSLVDGLMQVVTNIVTLNLLQSHPLVRALHNVFITFLLTESHSGFDFPWALHNVVPFGLLGGPPAHERHHQCGTVHLQQFFTYMDRAFHLVDVRRAREGENDRLRRLLAAGALVFASASGVAMIRWDAHVSRGGVGASILHEMADLQHEGVTGPPTSNL